MIELLTGTPDPDGGCSCLLPGSFRRPQILYARPSAYRDPPKRTAPLARYNTRSLRPFLTFLEAPLSPWRAYLLDAGFSSPENVTVFTLTHAPMATVCLQGRKFLFHDLLLGIAALLSPFSLFCSASSGSRATLPLEKVLLNKLHFATYLGHRSMILISLGRPTFTPTPYLRRSLESPPLVEKGDTFSPKTEF